MTLKFRQKLPQKLPQRKDNSMKRTLLTLLVVLTGFFIQNNLFSMLHIVRITPNLLLIITCIFGFLRGKKEGLLVGLLSGLLLDCFFGSTLGFYSLIYMYLGYLNGSFHRFFYNDNIIIPVFICGVSDFLYGCYIFITRFALRNRLNFEFYLTTIMIPEILYTIVIAVLVFGILLVVNHKIEEIEKRSAERFV